jgi:uncharacterized membrane protein
MSNVFSRTAAAGAAFMLLAADPAGAQSFPDDPPPPSMKRIAPPKDAESSDPPRAKQVLDFPDAPTPSKRKPAFDDGATGPTPAALLKSMNGSLQVVADESNPAEVRQAFRQAFDGILTSSEKVLKHPAATAADKNEAYQYQASILYQGARRGELGFADRLERLAETLYRAQPKTDVANLAHFLSVKARYEEDDGLRADALPAIQEYLKKYPREEAIVELLIDVAHHAEAEGRNAAAKEALDLVVKNFKRHEAAAKAPAVIRRLELVGKKLNLELSLMDGKKFAIDDRRRVVVVEFWSSADPNSVADQEILKDLYGRYKKDGLEIVGIPLDDKETAVQQHLMKNKVSWPQNVVPFEPKDQGFNHPVARQYGVMQVPTNFLVADGKVVATQIRGQALRRKVEELMGSASSARVSDRLPDPSGFK